MMSDRQGVNSIFQDDPLVVVCRESRFVDFFRANVVFPTSDGHVVKHGLDSLVKHGLDSISKTWTRLVKHGLD